MYGEIIKKTLDILFEKKYILMKALFIPFLLLSIIEYYSTHIIISKSTFYTLTALSFFVTIVMSINVHRILLLNEKETPKWGVYKFGQREMSFILKGIGLGLFLVLCFFILTVVFSLLEKIIYSFHSGIILSIYTISAFVFKVIFLGMIFSRISLVFPAIAIDKPIDFSDAFELSKNYKLLIFTMVIIFPILFAVIVSFVYGLAIKFLMVLVSTDLSILYSLLNIFITVFTIGFLSVTYEYITNHQPIKDEEEKILNEIEFYDNGDSFKMIIDDRYEITFDEIKKDLVMQYEKLGFNDIVIDKKDSWMLKNKEIQKAYILLSHVDNQFIVETFNIKEKPILSLD